MTEDDARFWLSQQPYVSRETLDQLELFVAFLREEARSQNLISASTIDHIWARHIVDSAQLLRFDSGSGPWLDLGTGAGFPGLVVALLTDRPMTLVESRSRRVDYLERVVAHLGISNRVRIVGVPLDRMATASFAVISARAFAPLPRLLESAARFSTANSLWLLPKGKNARKELHEVHGRWNVDFTVESSITDSEAGILVGHLLGERPRASTKGRRRL